MELSSFMSLGREFHNLAPEGKTVSIKVGFGLRKYSIFAGCKYTVCQISSVLAQYGWMDEWMDRIIMQS